MKITNFRSVFLLPDPEEVTFTWHPAAECFVEHVSAALLSLPAVPLKLQTPHILQNTVLTKIGSPAWFLPFQPCKCLKIIRWNTFDKKLHEYRNVRNYSSTEMRSEAYYEKTKLLSSYRPFWQHNYTLLTVSFTFFSIHPVMNISRIWQILSHKVLWQILNLFLIIQTYVALTSYVMFNTSKTRAKFFSITFIRLPAQASNIHFWFDLSHWHITIFDSCILQLPK